MGMSDRTRARIRIATIAEYALYAVFCAIAGAYVWSNLL
jgi:hypothetical protein